MRFDDHSKKKFTSHNAKNNSFMAVKFQCPHFYRTIKIENRYDLAHVRT